MKTKPILSSAKMKKCTNWLAAHGVRSCPLCGHGTLNVRDVVFVPVVETETQAPQGHGLSMVVIECARCVHLLMFDAVKIGLMGKGD
jgi:hypothetical protein